MDWRWMGACALVPTRSPVSINYFLPLVSRFCPTDSNSLVLNASAGALCWLRKGNYICCMIMTIVTFPSMVLADSHWNQARISFCLQACTCSNAPYYSHQDLCDDKVESPITPLLHTVVQIAMDHRWQTDSVFHVDRLWQSKSLSLQACMVLFPM